MEELSIEQKAKRYDEILKAAVVAYKDEDKHLRATLERIFSELTESEDERIRKQILSALKFANHKGVYDKHIAWLEKQGEQKPADKVEPKFKIGDLITNGIDIYKIKNVDLTGINYNFEDGSLSDITLTDNISHIWTIQDAKDGDVLAAHECLVLFKKNDGLNIKCYCTYHLINNPMFFVNTLQNKDAFNPATKEQRNLLFAKMKEAGYEWDAEKKELKKIGDESSWSEMDEIRWNNLICMVEAAFVGTEEKKYAEWLKSLKDKNKIQPPKQELSHNDEIILGTIIQEIEKIPSEKFIDNAKHRCLDWLRYRIKSLQHCPKWKPSDEQMRVLDLAIRCGINRGTTEETTLVSLFNGLKKLREE